MRSIVRRSASHALSALAAVGVLCIVVTLAGLLFDVRALVFKSGSMSPAIDTGALAFSRPVEAKDLKVGDIVSVPVKDSRVTHRIDKITLNGDEATLILKGDDNTAADAEPYTVGSADRVLLDVPYLGYVVTWFSGPVGMFAGGMLAAGLLFLVSRPGGGSKGNEADGTGRRRRTRASSGGLAVVLVAVAAIGTGAAQTEPTWAAWTDAASAQSGSFTAHKVSSQASPNCTDEGGLLGLLGYARLTWTQVDTRYEYVWTAVNVADGAELNSGVITPTGGVGSSITLDVRIGLLNLGLGGKEVAIRIKSRLKNTPNWQSQTVTVSRVRTAQLLVGLSVRCGDTETTPPLINFTMPFHGRPTSGVVPLQSAVRDACGSGSFGCGTVSDVSGIQMVEYQLKRVGNTTGTKCFNGNIYVDTCTFIQETNISGTTWMLDDALATTAYFFDGTFTLTIRAVDNVGNVSTASATFTTT